MVHRVASFLNTGPDPSDDDIKNVHKIISFDPDKKTLYMPDDTPEGIQKTKDYLKDASKQLGSLKKRPEDRDKSSGNTMSTVFHNSKIMNQPHNKFSR